MDLLQRDVKRKVRMYFQKKIHEHESNRKTKDNQRKREPFTVVLADVQSAASSFSEKEKLSIINLNAIRQDFNETFPSFESCTT